MSKYVTFSGRANRPEYWWFVLFVFLGTFVLAIIDTVIFGSDPETGETNTLLSNVFQIAMFLPALSAGFRRLHDSGRPGWYLLIPTGLSILFMLAMFFGVFAFGFAESHGADPEELRGSATVLGIAGLIVFGLAQLAMVALMIWWLTRPSDEGTNAYGPIPTF
ncbi:MAG: DUF805 domain-containing protein [Pseudomonadota bacterium]